MDLQAHVGAALEHRGPRAAPRGRGPRERRIERQVEAVLELLVGGLQLGGGANHSGRLLVPMYGGGSTSFVLAYDDHGASWAAGAA